MPAPGQYDRFRSFAERFLIARAPEFRLGFEVEDGWAAILQAKTLYRMAAMQAKDAEPVDLEMPQQAGIGALQGNAAQGMPPPGVTAAAQHIGGGANVGKMPAKYTGMPVTQLLTLAQQEQANQGVVSNDLKQAIHLAMASENASYRYCAANGSK